MTIPSTDPALRQLVERAHEARDAGAQVCIRGGGSKDFYGEIPKGDVLDTRILSGISSYEPTELVITARCGTALAHVEEVLAERGQCLPFEPPHFGAAERDLPARGATVGGMVAAGLSGPSRAAVGSVRDHVLGATLLNGKGEVLTFGGQVMKNVAGYDVSRLLAGSLGVLGLICEVSLKIGAMPQKQVTLAFDRNEAEALQDVNLWAAQPLPVNATAWLDGRLFVRLTGARAAVSTARQRLGGHLVDTAVADLLWTDLRDHTGDFFRRWRVAYHSKRSCWRLSVPSTTPPLCLPGDTLLEHGGSQRWLVTDAPADAVRSTVSIVGGTATLFYGSDRSAGAFAPLQSPLDRIHRELKKSFDPAGIFNPGRLYPGL